MNTFMYALAIPLRRYWRSITYRLVNRVLPWCKDAAIDTCIIVVFTAAFMGLWYYMFFIRRK